MKYILKLTNKYYYQTLVAIMIVELIGMLALQHYIGFGNLILVLVYIMCFVMPLHLVQVSIEGNEVIKIYFIGVGAVTAFSLILGSMFGIGFLIEYIATGTITFR